MALHSYDDVLHVQVVFQRQSGPRGWIGLVDHADKFVGEEQVTSDIPAGALIGPIATPVIRSDAEFDFVGRESGENGFVERFNVAGDIRRS